MRTILGTVVLALVFGLHTQVAQAADSFQAVKIKVTWNDPRLDPDYRTWMNNEYVEVTTHIYSLGHTTTNRTWVRLDYLWMYVNATANMGPFTGNSVWGTEVRMKPQTLTGPGGVQVQVESPTRFSAYYASEGFRQESHLGTVKITPK